MLICRCQQIGAPMERAYSEKDFFIYRELLCISRELLRLEVCPGSIFLRKVPVLRKHEFT